MKIVAQIIGYPIYGILYAGLIVLSGLYIIDFMHELFTDFRLMMIVVVFLGSLIFSFIYWGAMLAMIPLKMAIVESTGSGARLAGLALTPLGLIAGFLLWQVQNWLFFGIFDIDPWAYNGIFRHLGLAI